MNHALGGMLPGFWVLLGFSVYDLPAVNAALNALATVLLILGFVLIKRGRETAHRNVMYAAFATSIVFLGCYLTYHYAAGHVVFAGPQPWRNVYYVMLATHVVLAATVPFLALITIYLGVRDRRAAHRRVAWITFPIWLYVSITGVVIYVALYHVFAPPGDSSTMSGGPSTVQCRAVLRPKRSGASRRDRRRLSMFAQSNDSTRRFGRTALMLAVLAVIVYAAMFPSTASACPMCKAALASHDPHSGDMVSGYFYSILFMLCMPFIIFGSLSTYFYVLVRKARAAAAVAATTAAVPAAAPSPAEAKPRDARWRGESGGAKPAMA